MYVFFLICVVGMITIIPIYFLSVEHIKFQTKYGREKGLKIAKILGLISGWAFFFFLFGLWISPQPKFNIPLFQLKLSKFTINVFHLLLSIPIIAVGAWFGIIGVKEVTLKVAETHLPERVINTGIYSLIRHPQYFGAILSHVGISILLSSFFSILSSPLVILIIYIFSWKEEKELVKEFGKEYEDYKKSIPMLIPRRRKVKI